jgi:hypothetical protein
MSAEDVFRSLIIGAVLCAILSAMGTIPASSVISVLILAGVFFWLANQS